jgi:hypothetical protein
MAINKRNGIWTQNYPNTITSESYRLNIETGEFKRTKSRFSMAGGNGSGEATKNLSGNALHFIKRLVHPDLQKIWDWQERELIDEERRQRRIEWRKQYQENLVHGKWTEETYRGS